MRLVLCLILLFASTRSLASADSAANNGQIDQSSELPVNSGAWSRDSFAEVGRSRVQKMIDSVLPEQSKRDPAKTAAELKAPAGQ